MYITTESIQLSFDEEKTQQNNKKHVNIWIFTTKRKQNITSLVLDAYIATIKYFSFFSIHPHDSNGSAFLVT